MAKTAMRIAAIFTVIMMITVCAGCIETGNKFQPGDLIATGPGAPTGRDLGVWKVMDYNSEYDKYYIVGVAEIGNGRYLVFEDINMWLEREYAEEWFEKIGVLSPIFEEN